ncbi:MAG: biotin-dependent carboxyltransferase family protein [Kangiellaceae bacterium]|nr:biotin-dependent carboxyltransferase family protein [Kangiellaceae bacterium]MCW8998700.1 biotin-dependent carboxyltransferase family protein [Kangiellaceae bacterium]MCW9015941.1 biotin-dependent carboxyltransferase family protein [Kangiellaceae bacterium]
MSLTFLKPGLQTSIQDLGRSGKMHLGINQSGAMDSLSLKLANWLVGNSLNSPCLEITLMGPTIKFKVSTSIAVCGAEFDIYHNGDLVFNDETIQVCKGDILEFDKLRSGARAYLAIAGKLKCEKLFGSYSTHLMANFGGYQGRQIKTGDKIKVKDPRLIDVKILDKQLKLKYLGNYLIRFTDSIESNFFDSDAFHQFASNEYKISADSNRMGLRLVGQPISTRKSEQIMSSGLVPGTIQIPSSGLPIIAGVDGQTIGGYPRIGSVISADLPLLGQLKANDKIKWQYIEMNSARKFLSHKTEMIQALLK